MSSRGSFCSCRRRCASSQPELVRWSLTENAASRLPNSSPLRVIHSLRTSCTFLRSSYPSSKKNGYPITIEVIQKDFESDRRFRERRHPQWTMNYTLSRDTVIVTLASQMGTEATTLGAVVFPSIHCEGLCQNFKTLKISNLAKTLSDSQNQLQ
jgi:hypothetical protein